MLLVHTTPRGICGFSQISWKRLQCQTNLHFLQPWHLTSQDLGCHFYWQPGTGNLASHAKFDISPIHRTWWHGHNIIIYKHPSNYHRETVVFAFKISFKSFIFIFLVTNGYTVVDLFLAMISTWRSKSANCWLWHDQSFYIWLVTWDENFTIETSKATAKTVIQEASNCKDNFTQKAIKPCAQPRSIQSKMDFIWHLQSFWLCINYSRAIHTIFVEN